jgi:hypothetical protein
MGEQNNPTCDVADGFACYGTSPTDAAAVCTQFGCTDDTSCPATWWCATVNQAPNVTTLTPSLAPTRTVCLPRAYCAPCASDRDCPAAADGTEQHCTTDGSGAGYCSPECATDANCNLDATCKDWQSVCTPSQGAACSSDDDCPPSASDVAQHCEEGHCTPECASDSDCMPPGTPTSGAGASGATDGAVAPTCKWHRLCTPRAGVCVGTGGFCAPCRSDADCTNGYCLTGAPYSTERFCSVKSTTTPCSTTTLDPVGCPAHTASDNWIGIGCVSKPPNQCEGLVVLGTSSSQAVPTPGCWTVNR